MDHMQTGFTTPARLAQWLGDQRPAKPGGRRTVARLPCRL